MFFTAFFYVVQKKRGNKLSLVAKFAIACNITDMSNRSNLIH